MVIFAITEFSGSQAESSDFQDGFCKHKRVCCCTGKSAFHHSVIIVISIIAVLAACQVKNNFYFGVLK